MSVVASLINNICVLLSPILSDGRANVHAVFVDGCPELSANRCWQRRNGRWHQQNQKKKIHWTNSRHGT